MDRNTIRGQGLVEYLILVCLVAVAAIGVVSLVGKNLREQYANISGALRGTGEHVKTTAPDASVYQERGMDDFHQGAKRSRGGFPW